MVKFWLKKSMVAQLNSTLSKWVTTKLTGNQQTVRLLKKAMTSLSLVTGSMKLQC